jgi:hypothetical protein
MTNPDRKSANNIALSTFDPDRSSLCWRILLLLARNPDESYSDRDLALKFDVTSVHSVPQALMQPLAMGLVLQEGKSTARLWHAGPQLTAYIGSRTPCAAPAPAAAQTKRASPRFNPPDPDTVVVRYDVPMPVLLKGRQTGGSPYAKIFALMKPGGMVPLTDAQAKAFYSWAKKHAPRQLVTRLLPAPIDGLPRGAWRVEAPPQLEAVKAAAKTARTTAGA